MKYHDLWFWEVFYYKVDGILSYKINVFIFVTVHCSGVINAYLALKEVNTKINIEVV